EPRNGGPNDPCRREVNPNASRLNRSDRHRAVAPHRPRRPGRSQDRPGRGGLHHHLAPVGPHPPGEGPERRRLPRQGADPRRGQAPAGDKVKVRGKELVWKVYQGKGYFLDVNDLLGKGNADSVAYGVCDVNTDAALTDIQLRTGSDDQAVVYLNGKHVLKQAEDRELTKDDDITDVSLQKGTNVLVFKVVNEKEDWSGCACFTDKHGQVIKKLKVTSAPE